MNLKRNLTSDDIVKAHQDVAFLKRYGLINEDLYIKITESIDKVAKEMGYHVTQSFQR